MRKFYVLTIIVFLTYSTKAQNWWENHFVIGMMFDPPMRSATSASSQYQQAINAGFNLFTGMYEDHANVDTKAIYADMVSQFRNDSTFFFCLRSDTLYNVGSHDGRFYLDEPGLGEYGNYMNSLKYYITNNPGKLCYVNLYPYYAFGDWSTFENYIDGYYTDQNPTLPVVSYDNYYPHSSFVTYSSECNGRAYYSNLDAMRQRAGNRPLWCWIMTSMWLNGRNSSWQEAFLRLSSFAPLAYGAKGLLCYTYDARERYRVPRNLDYRTDTGWDALLYYPFPSNYTGPYDVFFGNFWPKSSGDHPDVGIKTDEYSGTWHLMHTTGTAGRDDDAWDYTNPWYGINGYTVPFTVMQDPVDCIGTMVEDRRFLVTNGRSGWIDETGWTLPGFRQDMFYQLSTRRMAAGNVNSIPGFELCMAWSDSIRIYYDYTHYQDPLSDTFTNGYTDTKAPSTVFQLIGSRTANGMKLYAVCQGYGSNGWTLFAYNGQTGQWTTKSISCSLLQDADHFWVEEQASGARLCMQVSHVNDNFGGYIYSGDITSASTVTLSSDDGSYAIRAYESWGVRNADGGYDLYCNPVAYFHTDAVMDQLQQPTAIYQMLSTINQYIRSTVRPVVMGCSWEGCYHASLPSDPADTHIKLLNETSLINTMSNSLMVGIFNNGISGKYLILVNKSNMTLVTAQVVLPGNSYSVSRMLPRIDTASTQYSQTYNPSTQTTTISWSDMTGGECVVLELSGP